MRWVTIVLHSFLSHWYLTTDSVHSSDPARPCSTLTTLCQTWLYCDHQWNSDNDTVWLSVHMNNFPFTVHCVQCCTAWYRPLVRSMLSEYVTICIANHAWYAGTDSLKYFPPLTTVLYLSPDDASCVDHTPAHVWSPVLFITRCSSNTQYFQTQIFLKPPLTLIAQLPPTRCYQ